MVAKKIFNSTEILEDSQKKVSEHRQWDGQLNKKETFWIYPESLIPN